MCHAGISAQTMHPVSLVLYPYSMPLMYGSCVPYTQRINMSFVMYLKVGMASVYI